MTIGIFKYIFPRNTLIGAKLDTTMRSRSKNSPASSKGGNGTIHRRKTWLKRKTNRQHSGLIAVRSQQVYWTWERQPPWSRGYSWSSNPNRSNDHPPYRTTWKQNRIPKTLLPNMPNYPGKRLNVHSLPKRNDPWLGRKMLLLQRIAVIKTY